MRKERNYWKNKGHVIEESKKFTTRTEFKKKSGNAYISALKNGWINDMPWLDKGNKKHPKGYWKNKDNMMNEARKYKTKEDFKNGNLSAFLAAYKYGFIDEMDWFDSKTMHKWGYWTYENIEKEAFKYDTKTEFYRGNQTAYKSALKLGVIDDFFFNNYVEYKNEKV